MAVEEEILSRQLEQDIFHNEDSKVSGIAKLAIDKGFASLSPAQKSILQPFLSQPCEGVTDPGDYHNDCQVVLEGEELRDAYDNTYQYDGLLCQSCIDEANDIASHRASFMKD
jgi:hypothetical protein